MATVRTSSNSLRVLGRSKTSESLKVRKGLLEEVSLELIKDES